MPELRDQLRTYVEETIERIDVEVLRRQQTESHMRSSIAWGIE